jgi:hypothetical protein
VLLLSLQRLALTKASMAATTDLIVVSLHSTLDYYSMRRNPANGATERRYRM